MRTLFISFSATLWAMAKGKIKQTALDNGLFYFGCTEEHARKPWATGYNELLELYDRDFNKLSESAARAVHERLIRAVTKAEQQGRVIWRESVDETVSLNKLNKLLRDNGYRAIDLPPSPTGRILGWRDRVYLGVRKSKQQLSVFKRYSEKLPRVA